MKHYKLTAPDNRHIVTISLDGPDADLTPPDAVAEKYLNDLRDLLPVTRKSETVTFHERHGPRLAQWLCLLIANGEGVELTASEIAKPWPPWGEEKP